MEDGERGMGSSRSICIEDLPDDIIMRILSQLTLREAASTSILSRRWRFTWTSLPSLKFVTPRVILGGMDQEAFCRMVNQVLKIYKSPILHQLSISHHPLDSSSSYYINSWFSFAIATEVSRFELELFSNLNKYVVPLDLFDRREGIEPYLAKLYDYDLPSHSSIVIPSLGAGNRFKSIRELVLKSVDFGDDVFEAILSSCSMLEFLVLSNNSKLINARHAEPLLHLRCLEILLSLCLENLEISAPNLVSFKYDGKATNICIKDAQRLVELSLFHRIYPEESYLDLAFPKKDDFVFSHFAAYLSCLEKFTININFCLKKGRREFRRIPIFSKLKRLSLFFSSSNCPQQYYHVAVSLINASPCLHQLELNSALLHLFDPGSRGRYLISEERAELLRMVPLSVHGSLREILLDDSGNHLATLEFLDYLVGYTVAVEKIEIIRRDLSVAKMYLDLIRGKISPNAQLVAIERVRSISSLRDWCAKWHSTTVFELN